MSNNNLSNVKHIILVLSGKGGVGKSTVATQLACSFVESGNTVGILDIDLTGPSIPRMLNLHTQKVYQSSQGWIPVYATPQKQLAIMSIAFLTKQDEAIVWRGPKKTVMIKQFVEDVQWGCLDYLIIDTPPGTSDEHISIVQILKEYHPSAVMVTTPQGVSLIDVRKELDFCKKVGLECIGMIENMSGYACPHCKECTNIFSSGGGEKLAEEFGIAFLGRVPIDGDLTRIIELGNESIQDNFKSSTIFPLFQEMSLKIAKTMSSSSTI